MGCKNGGMPWCPYTNKRQTDSVCRNGDPMYMNGVLKYREEFRSGTNCIKIDLPGKLILSKKKGLKEVLTFSP